MFSAVNTCRKLVYVVLVGIRFLQVLKCCYTAAVVLVLSGCFVWNTFGQF